MTNIIIGIAVFAILFVIMYIKITIDEKKGINSPEKQRIYEIAQEVIPNIENYCVVYATREDFSLSGGGSVITTTTKYWYYAAALNCDELFLIPLSFEDGEILYSEPLHFDIENLGMVKTKNHGYLTLYDKDKKEILSIDVSESNTKDDKYHPVNIQQKEETKEFIEISKDFAEGINTEQ